MRSLIRQEASRSFGLAAAVLGVIRPQIASEVSQSIGVVLEAVAQAHWQEQDFAFSYCK